MSSSSMDVSFLRSTPMFRHLDADSLAAIRGIGELIECPPGTILIQAGSEPEDLYILKQGVLEVRRGDNGALLSFVFAGEVVGEMSILTRSPRSATVRVPEFAEVLRIPGPVFERLLAADARIALAVARSLALRLQRSNTTQPEPEVEAPQHLAGDLRFFDVAEMVQTILGSRRAGEMRLVSASISGEAYLSFQDGQLVAARAGRLVGRAAVLYLLRRKLEGRFEFRAGPGIVDPAEGLAEDSPLSLILEAAQERDEIDAIRAKLPAMNHVPRQGALGPLPSLPSLPFAGPLDAASESDRRARAQRGEWRPATEDERVFARRLFLALDGRSSLGQLLESFSTDERLAHEVMFSLFESGAAT